MTHRATFRQADLNTAVKVAKKNGWQVVLDGPVIRLLPIDPNAPLPSSEPDSDWDKALGLK